MGVRIALATFVVLALGAACDGGDPAPSPLPSTTTAAGTTAPATSTPAPTPTASPPTLPAVARQDSPAGAEAFARFYIQTLDYSYQSRDTQLLRQLARCSGCDAVADGIDQWSSEGGRYEGGRLAVINSGVVKHVRGSAGLIALTYSRTDRILVSATGEREPVPGSPALNVLVTERKVSSGWLITKIQVVK